MKFKNEKGLALFWVIFICIILNLTTGINMVGNISDEVVNSEYISTIQDKAESTATQTKEAIKEEAKELLNIEISSHVDEKEFQLENIGDIDGVEIDKYEEIDGKKYVYVYYCECYMRVYFNLEVYPIEITIEHVE